MSDTFDFEVKGFDEVQEALKSMPGALARKILRNALIPAAKLWRDEMAQRAPRLINVKTATNPKQVRIPGDLARHIGMQVSVNSDLQGTVKVGPTKRVFWASFLEFGTSKMRAQPFIRPTFEALASQVLNRFYTECRKALADLLPKASSSGEGSDVPLTECEAENRAGWRQLENDLRADLARADAALAAVKYDRSKSDPIGYAQERIMGDLSGMVGSAFQILGGLISDLIE
jgi:HK97 gp10 family phage protein